MRKHNRVLLEKFTDKDYSFSGTFGRYGREKVVITKPTIVLEDIKDSRGNILTSHLWFNKLNKFSKLGKIPKGARLFFTAKAKEYTKRNGVKDMMLDDLNNVMMEAVYRINP